MQLPRWSERGGIVTLRWNWDAPDIGTGYENAKKDFDVAAALRPGTSQNRAMMRDLDWYADQPADLKARHVAVLWRPSRVLGDRFWWGKHGPDGSHVLWRLMYEHSTAERG